MAGMTETIVGFGRNTDIARYAKWEYGTNATEWLIASARRYREGRDWVTRLRYWLNSFRGFAAFDVHGTDDRTRP